MGSESYTIPKQELADVLLDRLFWKAWAKALHASRAWKE